ncbi:catechol 2,3-dioxygenase-like lactoylglutathione lyase family enzyme [Thermocatellispora tengchongensis]|uniref:Catechol 2,3-dioxygenase-like lactoylglutathione lyase family enzyme n=1 Tax=Thermocatellispora tengchongensis TaxID=1073253 RepID=A0A840PFJ9_9ACTN|nr:hypothetical protein [Thermocatellispora tengchongensis]MBB5136723.1 catechol 2,3-dioxygenase-like lactoylglutathione lyase family enzyme [Thermocatellispora tengchongensis]
MSPAGARGLPGLAGVEHVGFTVPDLDAAVAYVRAYDVTVLGEPTAGTGPSEGQRWVYFLAPWGMQFELVSFPHGKAYEKATARDGGRGPKLWQPVIPEHPPR